MVICLSTCARALAKPQRILSTPCRNFGTEGSTVERIIATGDLSDPPKDFNFTRDVIDYWAQRENPLRAGELPALWFVQYGGGSATYTYTELSQRSRRIADAFRSSGLEKGDRLLLCLPKCAEYWLVVLAALRCGIEYCSVTTQATGRDLHYRIEQFDPKMVVSDKISDVNEASEKSNVQFKVSVSNESKGWLNLSNLISAAGDFEGHPTTLSDPMLVFFTSGTTGKPKMAEHTNDYLLSHTRTARHFYDLHKSDVFLCMSDTGWAKAAYGAFPTWLMGACSFVDATPRFDPHVTLAMLRDHPVTKFCAPPTIYRQLVKETTENFEFRALRDCVSAGEPLNPEAYHQWQSLTGLSIREGYGQSELNIIACTKAGAIVKPGSIGQPIEGFKLVVIDENRRPVAQGEQGQLAISTAPTRPLGIMKCYRNDPDKTAEVFVDGYYLTGDKVYQDSDGYIWFVSRSDDVITSSGYRIGPFEIENVLLEHPAVLESAVVGVPDPDRFEAVKAFVVLTQEYQGRRNDAELVTELQTFVKERTAPYKYPRQLEFVTTLPKTMSGKIQRHVLRQKGRLAEKTK